VSEDEYRLPYIPKGAWLEERFVRCGKDCRCRLGEPHGTYWRLVWRVKGKGKRQRYVATEHLAMYQTALELRRKQVAHRRGWMRSTRAALAHARAVLRAVNERTRDVPRYFGRRRTASDRMLRRQDPV